MFADSDVAEFIAYCNALTPLTREAELDMAASLKSRHYSKNETLLQEGETCRYIYLITQGLVKIWAYKNDKELIHCIFAERVPFSVFDSFLGQTPSNFVISAIEQTSVLLIHHEAMERLSKKHHCLESLFKKFADYATISMIKRISSILEDDALTRYEKFRIENKAIIQRLSLGDIARYLGITQPSLSRIRNQK